MSQHDLEFVGCKKATRTRVFSKPKCQVLCGRRYLLTLLLLAISPDIVEPVWIPLFGTIVGLLTAHDVRNDGGLGSLGNGNSIRSVDILGGVPLHNRQGDCIQTLHIINSSLI